MKAIIYETINLYNKERGILPYRYIGSDQHNKPNYYGSNKKLIEDIKRIGTNYFIKIILFEYDSVISNIELRKLESEYQQRIDAAKNPEFYNKTNFSHKGFIETEEEKKNRMLKLKNKRDLWWNSLSFEEQSNFRINAGNIFKKRNQDIKGKTYEEIYGKELSVLKRNKHKGSKNGMSRAILHIDSGEIFDTMKSIAIFLKINPTSSGYAKIRKMCNTGTEIKYIN